MAIETARPKLVASLAEAKEPVDLDVLAALTNGEDMLYLYWAKAMETWDTEDPQVLQLAAMAQAQGRTERIRGSAQDLSYRSFRRLQIRSLRVPLRVPGSG